MSRPPTERPPEVPNKCPITGLPFFMMIEHPDGYKVPTYGGPYDSYTIPQRDDDGDYVRERYDHDEGGWVDGCENICVQVLTDQQVLAFESRINALEAELADWRESAAKAAAETCGNEKHCTCVGPLREHVKRLESLIRDDAAKLERYETAFRRSTYDISPCCVCGCPVVCLPEGLSPMCKECWEIESAKELISKANEPKPTTFYRQESLDAAETIMGMWDELQAEGDEVSMYEQNHDAGDDLIRDNIACVIDGVIDACANSAHPNNEAGKRQLPDCEISGQEAAR